MDSSFYSTIIGAFIGASAALLGTWLMLRAERKKAKEEREFLAKHQALISAAESVTRFLNYYLTIPDRELPRDGMVPDEVSAMSVAMNRLHFYCGIETIKSAIDMEQILSKSYASAVKEKMSSVFVAEEIKALECQISDIKKANNQIEQEIVALLLSAPSSLRITSHRQQVADNASSISDLSVKKGSLIEQRYRAIESCRDAMRKNLKEIYKALRTVLLMARRELAFPINEQKYEAMLSQATEETLADMESLCDEIRTEVEKRLQ